MKLSYNNYLKHLDENIKSREKILSECGFTDSAHTSEKVYLNFLQDIDNI